MNSTATASITLRGATVDDLGPLVRLAQLDSRRLPKGPYVVAEADGRLVAAVVVANGDTFADPFLPTASTVELLKERAAQLAGASPNGLRSAGRTSWAARRPASPLAALGAIRLLVPAALRRT